MVLNMRRYSGIVLAGLASLAIVSCQKPPVRSHTVTIGPSASQKQLIASLFDKPRKPTGPINIQIITNGIAPFWSVMVKGMDKARADLHCNASWEGPEPADPTIQKNMFESAVAKGVDGIAISAIDAKALGPDINKAIAKGIPVITYDSDVVNCDRIAYIGTNNYVSGQTAGKLALKYFPKSKYPVANLIGFVGNLTADNARLRVDGFKDAIKGSNVHLLEVLEDNKDKVVATNNVTDAINKYPHINGFVGFYSYNGPAIVNAVTSAGIRNKVKIICFDAEPGTITALRHGEIDATVVQKPYYFGYLVTKFLYLLNRKGLPAAEKALHMPADNILDTGVQVVTPANVNEFYNGLRKIGVTSS